MAKDKKLDESAVDLSIVSTEELARHNHAKKSPGVFEVEGEAPATPEVTQADKVKKVLDKYIAKHSSTTSVREMAVKHKRTADAQLDLSADLVAILTKIKSELG